MKETLNPKDFRLGNYLEYYSGDKYFQITIDDLIIINNGESRSKPIPLTEEWLLKFGFEKGKNVLKYQLLNDIEILYEIDIKVFFLQIDKGSHTDIDLLFVHQIQNLYFALTGEELTIKF